MNKILIAGILGILLLSIFLICWRSRKEAVISEIGVIKYLPLEGGFYGIVTEKGERYLPLNLPEEFKKDGLKVWFKAKLRKDVATIYAWGKLVEILEIQEIGKEREKVENLSQVKAILYERVGDGKLINRSIEDEIRIFKETKADFIFRAFWRWNPCPEKCEDLPAEKREVCELRGYSYSHLEKSISKIKSEIPDIIICGAIPAQIIHKNAVWNPKSREIIRYPETWELALDPSKWGINMSKEEFQCRFAKTHLWIPNNLDCKDYTPEIASAYFPDITNEKFQELLLSWAERQIDAGADAIWIDMLFKQASILYKLTNDFNHTAVKESYEAARKIVNEIHEYGKDKGKKILVGSWATPVYFPYTEPKLDFVTISPSSKEVREMRLDEEKWNERLKLIRGKFGDIPVFAFIDWASTIKTPLGQFSQNLSKEEQREFLKIADRFFTQKGVIFVYPVHGGFMGRDAKILSFGKLKIYDSLAPEFHTYETIKELAQNKTKPKLAFPSWINEPLFEMIQSSKKGTLTFKEQEKMLPLLAEMGIKTIYLTPIWEYKPGTSLSRYYILNYYELDPSKGTEEDFKEFIEEAHNYGMKVILDLVTGHTGPSRYIYENHKDWILRDKYGNLVYCWPHKQWGYAVDRANPKVIEHFTKIAKYYVDKFDIDGWRMDAIGALYCNETVPDCPQPVEGRHHSEYLLKSVKSALGEDKALYLEWGYLGRLYLLSAGVKEEGGCPVPNPIPCYIALPELNEYADASYSYEFGKCFMRDIIGGKITSKDFVDFFKRECLYYGKPRGRFLMTHDFGYQFYEKNPKLHKVGAVLITTIPGFPHIYHREIFPDGDASSINQEIFNLYKKLLRIREKFKAIKQGAIESVWKGGDNVIAYMRKYEDEKVVIVANFQGKSVTSTLKIPFEKGEVLYDLLNDQQFLIDNPNNFEVTLPPYGVRILVRKESM